MKVRTFVVVATEATVISVLALRAIKPRDFPQATSVNFSQPTAAWCQQASLTPEPDYSLPIHLDGEYYREQYCYWQWLESTCTSLQACPRPPMDGGAKGRTIWKRLRKLNQKNLILSRMMYLWSFFADKHQLKWAVVDGSMLGALRGKALLPHDYDVDIWIDPTVGGGWQTFYNRYHEDFPTDMVLHHENNRMYLRDLNSCRYPDGSDPLYGFALDLYGYMTPTHPAFPTALFSYSGTDGLGKRFPAWKMTKKQLRERFGKDYAAYRPRSLTDTSADFTTDVGCPLMSKTGPSCGIDVAAQKRHFVRAMHWSNTTCWKERDTELEWDGSSSGIPTEDCGEPLPDSRAC
jgi:hypothetical protein